MSLAPWHLLQRGQEFGVSSGFRVRVQSSGFRAQGLAFLAYGLALGFRVFTPQAGPPCTLVGLCVANPIGRVKIQDPHKGLPFVVLKGV